MGWADYEHDGHYYYLTPWFWFPCFLCLLCCIPLALALAFRGMYERNYGPMHFPGTAQPRQPNYAQTQPPPAHDAGAGAGTRPEGGHTIGATPASSQPPKNPAGQTGGDPQLSSSADNGVPSGLPSPTQP